jgi:hypothetical protein
MVSCDSCKIVLWMNCPKRTTVTLFYDAASRSVIPSPDSTLGAGLESMESMKRTALYARVSSDGQQKEGTIESQIVELKKQIAAAGQKNT